MPNEKIKLNYLIPVFYFVAIMLMVIFQWTWQNSIRNGSGSPIYRNLMNTNAYIRQGFDPQQLMNVPDAAENTEWFQFESPPLTIRNSALPDLPPRRYLSPFGKPAQEYTIIIPVEMDSKAISFMENDSSVVPGIYFSIIGENWEIFLNGNLVRSEMHLDQNGQIKSNRTWRDVHFPLDKNLFVPGTNILVLRIVGDPSYNVTGLYYAEPHYIDDYNTILMQHQSYVRYFVCGVLGYTGIYYLLVFLSIRNRKEIHNLYYSIFSLFLCIHFIATEGTVHNLIPNSDISARLEYITLFLAMTMLCIFIEQIGRQRVSKISWGFLAFSLYIGITQIFFCNQYADEVMHIFLLLTIVYFSFIFFGIVRAHFARQRNNNNKASGTFFSILVGSLVVYACGIHDALDVVVFRNAFRLFLYSTFVFHLGMTLAMSRRFSKVYKELEQSNVILEKTVHERTLELEEQTMIAVQASQTKSQFLATMSHEIRTPLNAVIGLSEIELQGKLAEKSRDNINQIYQSGTSLLAIINDILDISKIEAGSFNVIPVEYETAPLINDTVNLIRVRIASRPIIFILEIDGDFPEKLVGDERRIKQILNNVLSNAIKYTKEGSVTLTIKWEKLPQKNKHSAKTALLRFIVSDTGIGIRPGDIDKLFSDYAQLDTKANRRIEGTGLGLAITKKLLETMGGSIKVESEYGKGSVFTIELLQNLVQDESIGEDTASRLRNFQYVSAGRGRTINRSWMPYGTVLVVDDMPVNLQVAKGLLAPYGLNVDTAASGQEAIDMALSGKKYDLIFMDHMMPEMDGIEAAEKIRAYEIEKKTTSSIIVALTANALVGSMEMFISKGFNGFISKPIDIVQLDDALNKWIRDKQSKHILEEAAKEDKNKEAKDSLENIEEPDFVISGVDIKNGITLTGGTLEGYKKVLSLFCKDAQDRILFIGKYKNEGLPESKTPEFVIHVHALKSALASLGAGELSAKAAKLEAAGRTKDYGFINENLVVFTEQLPELVNNITNALEVKTEIDGGKSGDFLPLLQELALLLKAETVSSKIDIIIEELLKNPLDSKTREALEKISDEVLVAEYGKALAVLSDIF